MDFQHGVILCYARKAHGKTRIRQTSDSHLAFFGHIVLHGKGVVESLFASSVDDLDALDAVHSLGSGNFDAVEAL